jgi:hypothetical protein
MPGCSATLVAAASMTGSTNPGPIQPQQDSVPLLDDSLFTEEGARFARRGQRRASRSNRNNMSSPAVQSIQPVQLTPLWEYVVRNPPLLLALPFALFVRPHTHTHTPTHPHGVDQKRERESCIRTDSCSLHLTCITPYRQTSFPLFHFSYFIT